MIYEQLIVRITIYLTLFFALCNNALACVCLPPVTGVIINRPMPIPWPIPMPCPEQQFAIN